MTTQQQELLFELKSRLERRAELASMKWHELVALSVREYNVDFFKGGYNKARLIDEIMKIENRSQEATE